MKGSMDIFVYVFRWTYVIISLRNSPRNGVAVSEDKYMFSLS